MIALSQYKEEVPWLYDVIREAYVAESTGHPRNAWELIHSLEISLHGHALRRIAEEYSSKEVYMLLSEIPEVLHMVSSVLKNRAESMGKAIRASSRKNSSPSRPTEKSSDTAID